MRQRARRLALRDECNKLNSELSAEDLNNNLHWKVFNRNGTCYKQKVPRRRPAGGSFNTNPNLEPLGDGGQGPHLGVQQNVVGPVDGDGVDNGSGLAVSGNGAPPPGMESGGGELLEAMGLMPPPTTTQKPMRPKRTHSPGEAGSRKHSRTRSSQSTARRMSVAGVDDLQSKIGREVSICDEIRMASQGQKKAIYHKPVIISTD